MVNSLPQNTKAKREAKKDANPKNMQNPLYTGERVRFSTEDSFAFIKKAAFYLAVRVYDDPH